MEMAELRKQAEEADLLVREGRDQLVAAIRRAHAEGASQRQIADAVNRSQPEVNRLLRFHGTSRNGRALREALPEVKKLLGDAGLSSPRVFGSTARGDDEQRSDIDLLVTPKQTLSLLAQARLEQRLSTAVGVPVDLVFDNALREDLAERILAEAVPL